MKQVLDNIKALRAIRGLSQEAIAQKLDCDYSTYGKIENGKSSLTLKRLFQLAEILSTDVVSLITNNELQKAPQTVSTGPMVTISLSISDLNKPEVQAFLQTIK